MKKQFIFVVILLVTLGVANHTGEAQTMSTLAMFDEDVAQCRRVVREYCAIVRDMMKEKELDPVKQERGIALVQQARQRWIGVISKWGENPPAEYASDPVFRARLRDFANALEDMEGSLSSGDTRRSFMACGFGCGLFVAMHEQNGISYALDALFHLRKSVNTAGTIVKAQNLEKVRPLLIDVMRMRDRVLTAPAPWPRGDERLIPYYEAVRQLSRKLDEWVLAVDANDLQASLAAHSELFVQINKAYGLVL
jgi:hypothetical protein